MKVALVVSPYKSSSYRMGESLGIKYLAAVLEHNGIGVDVFQANVLNLTVEAIVNRLLKKPYDLIGFSLPFSGLLPTTIEIIRLLRISTIKPHVTVGGHFATFEDRELLESFPEVNSVVRFEGENTLLELVACLKKPNKLHTIKGLSYRLRDSIYVNEPRDLIKDLDTLPFPKRDITSKYLGNPHFLMISSRGCYGNCTFCSVCSFYRIPSGSKWRIRSVDNVLDELYFLQRDWGAKTISFLDDNFIGSCEKGRARALKIADAIKSKKLYITWSIDCRAQDIKKSTIKSLKEAGLKNVFLGIESGCQSQLNRYGKNTTVNENRKAIMILKEMGVDVECGFIIFDAYTSIEEIKENLRFISEFDIGTFNVISNRLQVYGGTRIKEILSRENNLVKNYFEYDYSFRDKKVESIYKIITNALKPIHDVDILFKKAIFIEQTERFEKNLSKLFELRKRLSSVVVMKLNEVIQFVEKNDNTKASLAHFTRQFKNDIINFINNFRQQIETIMYLQK
ncbi:hypothetical protein ES707_05799 [subsurface metagenome]